MCFSDKAIFHVNAAVNEHNCRIRGNKNSHVTCELKRDNAKVKVWHFFIHWRVTAPLVLKPTVTVDWYLDMLKL
jgi:hypothetical protein